MIPAPRYLKWARQHYGNVPFDLASSGIPPISLTDLGFQGDETSLALRLDDLEGPARLRHAIAAWNGVPEAEVALALGTTHALWLAYASVLEPGDEVLVESPAYEPLILLAEAAGGRVVHFERGIHAGFAVDLDRVAAALTPRTRVVAVSTPHNPSGRRTDDATLRGLAELLAPRGALLLVDEVYAPLDDLTRGLATPDAPWRASARRLGGNVLAVSSLTKSFGLGPHRVGWLLGPPSVVERAEDIVLATCGSYPLAHAALGARAFAHLPALGSRAVELTRGKRELAKSWMDGREDLLWSDPAGGLFGFAMRREPGDLLPLIEEGARRDGVLVGAGAFFGVPNGFRLSWSISRESFPRALDLLAGVLGG
jgi:aspartate/methionine/tyrosine aminotransferase